MKLANQLIFGDSMEVMSAIPTGRYDIILTDLPYGTTDFTWDKKVKLSKFWELVNKITTPDGIVIHFSQQPFTTELISSAASGFKFRHEIIWLKTCAVGFLDANRRPLRAHENILIFSKKGRFTYNPQKTPGEPYTTKKRKFAINTHYGDVERVPTSNESGDRFPLSVQKFNNRPSGHWHPTQKPLDLIEWLVKSYTDPGQWVLDPFAGSCVVAHACRHTGRRFTCIEKSLDYYNRAFAVLFPGRQVA